MPATLLAFIKSAWSYLKYFVALFFLLVSLLLALIILALLPDVGHLYREASIWIELFALIVLSAWCMGCAVALVRKPQAPVLAPPKQIHQVAKLLAAVAVTVSLFIVMPPFLAEVDMAMTLWSQQNPGPFDRAKMEQVVAQVRKFDFKGEKTFIFDTAGNVTDPAGKKWNEWDNSIDARRADDGTLSLTIQTRYLGHGGTYGFAYSDKILIPEKDPETGNGLVLDVPGELNQTDRWKKIDNHWWKVFDDRG